MTSLKTKITTPLLEETARPWGRTYLYLRDPNSIQVIVHEGNW